MNPNGKSKITITSNIKNRKCPQTRNMLWLTWRTYAGNRWRAIYYTSNVDGYTPQTYHLLILYLINTNRCFPRVICSENRFERVTILYASLKAITNMYRTNLRDWPHYKFHDLPSSSRDQPHQLFTWNKYQQTCRNLHIATPCQLRLQQSMPVSSWYSATALSRLCSVRRWLYGY